MLKVGNLIINLNAIAYVDLEAKTDYVIGETKIISGVRIYLNVPFGTGNKTSLFFKGEKAEYLRKYFLSVAHECGGVKDV
jgi:hypothetical protein